QSDKFARRDHVIAAHWKVSRVQTGAAAEAAHQIARKSARAPRAKACAVLRALAFRASSLSSAGVRGETRMGGGAAAFRGTQAANRDAGCGSSVPGTQDDGGDGGAKL